MSKQELIATVHDQRKKVARIALNGYNVASGGPLGRTGTLRSFRFIEGDLWDQWASQRPIVLHAEDGRTIEAKVAAFPAESDSFGFIEFI